MKSTFYVRRGTKWKSLGESGSGQAHNAGQHGERKAYSNGSSKLQKGENLLLFVQDAFPCMGKITGGPVSCHNWFLNLSSSYRAVIVRVTANQSGYGLDHGMNAPCTIYYIGGAHLYALPPQPVGANAHDPYQDLRALDFPD